MLDQFNTYTHVWDLTPANTIIADVLSGTGLTSDGDTEPTTAITAVFYNANRLDAIKFIAESTGNDFWSDDGTEIKWGVRGSGNLWVPTTLLYSTRGIDRSKKVDIVRVRGIDVYGGYHIVGVAGTGTKTKVLNETRPTDEAGLNAIAARRLAELSTDSCRSPNKLSYDVQCNV